MMLMGCDVGGSVYGYGYALAMYCMRHKKRCALM